MGAHKTRCVLSCINVLIVRHLVKDNNNKGKGTRVMFI